MENIYKEAILQQLRFNLGNGEVTICDLIHYSLERLDNAYSSLCEELESSNKNSLLKPKTTVSKQIELKLAIIKDIVETKQAELQAKKDKANKQAQAALIREKLAEKKIQALDTKSEEDLLKMLEDLES